MSLRLKFNLVMLVVLSIGIALSYIISQKILLENAEDEVLLNARIMMAMAKSVRAYTVNEVRPIINKHDHGVFLPQTVPAYAARKNFDSLRKIFPKYSYKEATINPTNPAHRANDFESGLVDYFNNNTHVKEFSGIRDSAVGKILYLSRPIRITNAKCLACHSQPESAPQSMRDLYGDSNGFGWKLNDVVASQIVSVPMTVPLQRAQKAFHAFMFSLTSIFLFIWGLLNILLYFVVIKPIRIMSDQAYEISRGQLSLPEFTVRGKDEVAVMANSFNRLRRSITVAMKIIKHKKPNNRMPGNRVPNNKKQLGGQA